MYLIHGAFQAALMVKNPPSNAGALGYIPGWEDLLEREMATHSSFLAWEIPWTEEPGGLQSMGSQKSWITTEHRHTHVNHTYVNQNSSYSPGILTRISNTEIQLAILNVNNRNIIFQACRQKRQVDYHGENNLSLGLISLYQI